jgi:cytochrome c oxidase subunit II
MGISSILKPFGLPENASEHGELVDNMDGFVHWFMLFLFVGWSIYLVHVFYRYNAKRNPRANYAGVTGHSTTHIEIGVCIVEAILLFGFAFPLWARQADEFPTGPEVVKLRAVGEQFGWSFHYAGNDGVLGGINPKLTSPSNVIGRDMTDPNGKDDFLNTGMMKIPVNRPVIIDVRSKDVIHNLALTSMRAAQDATPGVKSHIWFKPIKVGTWDIICGQLCGPGHSGMRAVLEVVTDKEYEAWLKERSEAAANEAAPSPAASVSPPAAVVQ